MAPEHQGNGVGSMLVRWGCDMADKDILNCFVMASPGGLALYNKFDFKVIGEVCTEHGSFTSMYRKPKRSMECAG